MITGEPERIPWLIPGPILLAVFLVFVVMAVQYEKLSNPLVILTAVPLALIGVALILWLTATPLSAPVMLGVILLAYGDLR